MPELPEVETMRRGILGVVGSRIEDVERLRPRCKPIRMRPRIDAFRRRAVDRRVDDVARVGKRVVLWLDSHEAIVLEPRMTGLVLLADPPSLEHLRLRIQLSGTPGELFYWDRRGLGSVQMFTADEFATNFGPAKVGPDALHITAEIYRQQLGTSKRAIKVALLDQRAVSGIGNLYAAEILHVARIHPARPCHRVTRRQWDLLTEATRAVLEEAIRYEGSTLSDGTYRNALNQVGSYQNEHRVYAKAGQLCPTCCQGTILRVVQGQRATFFCPYCQRPAPRGFS